MFSRLLATKLRNANVEVVDFAHPGRGRHYRVTGNLDVPSALARVKVEVPLFFSELKRDPPSVWCLEKWMRNDPNWHNSNQTGMCWVLNDEWRDVMGCQGKSWKSVVDDGVRWLVNNSTNLISRHHLGDLEGIDDWPEEWEAWGHNEEGPRQYERSKKK